MANKKEESRSFLQYSVPMGNGKRYTSEKAYLYGLDRRMNADSSCMNACKNIDVTRLPEIVSVQGASHLISIAKSYGDIVGVFGYSSNIYIACENDDKLYLLRITEAKIAAVSWWENNNVNAKREMVVFCSYNAKEGQMAYDVNPSYDLLVYPDRKYVDAFFEDKAEPRTISAKMQSDEDSTTSGESFSPVFDHITVWNSRLFGSANNVVVCSCASTFQDWTCDTREETDSSGFTVGGYDATHAWYSTTQANTQASGDITAMTTYDGHPIIFKDDYMHQINNTKNPFRIQDIVAIGCVSARAVCELDGILYFVSKDGVYRYGGGYPKKISDALNCMNWGDDVVCGAFDGVLYVFNPLLDNQLIFTFCPANGLWAAIENPHGTSVIIAFVSNDNAIYSVAENNTVFEYLARKEDPGDVEWSFVSDTMLADSASEKRIHGLEVVADGDDIKIIISQDSKSDGDLRKIEIKKDSLYGTDKVRALVRRSDSLWHRLNVSGSGKIRIRRIDVLYSYSAKRYK